jgi:hypothetical protein
LRFFEEGREEGRLNRGLMNQISTNAKCESGAVAEQADDKPTKLSWSADKAA